MAQVRVSFAFPLCVNFYGFPAKAKYQIECLLTVPLGQTSILDFQRCVVLVVNSLGLLKELLNLLLDLDDRVADFIDLF